MLLPLWFGQAPWSVFSLEIVQYVDAADWRLKEVSSATLLAKQSLV